MRDSWFDAAVRWFERLPGPPVAAIAAITVVLALPLHLAEWFDDPARLSVHPDLVIGAATPGLFLWVALVLNRAAVGALDRLRPALDPSESPEAIAADLVRTPGPLAIAAVVVGLVGGISSVLQSPANWGIDPAHPGARQMAALVLSAGTEVLLIGLLAHVLHQLRVVTRVHRTSVRIDLFHLQPLYAFSTLTARTGITLIVLVVTLIVALSATTGALLITGASDLAITASIFGVAIACFVLPLLGLHGRIADAKEVGLADAQGTLGIVLREVRARVARGDLEGAAKLKDATLAAESGVAAIVKISTWPWRTETLRAFVSAVLLPIGLFLVYELLRRVLG